MKKKIRMICILKSGAVIKDSLWVKRADMDVINKLKSEIENALAKNSRAPEMFTFAYTSVRCEDVAAIKIW